jgi:predicted transcriptional regulator YdeE
MVEIVKTYRQSVPALRFIGKKYGDADRIDGTFGAKWGEWHENGWFGIIEKQMDNFMDVYEDGDAYIGLMRGGHDAPFEYWIGIFMPENTTVPEGFEYVDFPKSEWGICWTYGKESEIYCLEGQCAEKLSNEGFEIITDWCFERYACPRFTTPDEKGNIILDIGFFVK